jgi:hypothetical protein
MRGTAAMCFRVAVPAAGGTRSGKSAGHLRLQELQSDARAPRGDSGSARRIVACPASRASAATAGPVPGPGVIPDAGYGRARTGAVRARDGHYGAGAAGGGLPGRRWPGSVRGAHLGQQFPGILVVRAGSGTALPGAPARD